MKRIPATAIPRTLLDAAATQQTRWLDGLIEKAERMEILDLDALDRTLSRAGGHHGRNPLESALLLYRDPIFSRARSERLLRSAIKKAGLPLPQINIFIDKYEIDAYWPEERFAVEIDGWGSHRTRAAFERDPLRIEGLKLIGIDAIRITARRLEREPDRVAERIGAFLARRRAELRNAGGRSNGG